MDAHSAPPVWGIARAWWITIAVSMGCALGAMGLSTNEVPHELVIDGLIADKYTFQWANGTSLIGSMVGMALIAPLGMRHGLRQVFLQGILQTAIGALLAGVSTNIGTFAVARGIQGLGKGITLAGSYAILARDFPSEWSFWRTYHRLLASAVFVITIEFVASLVGVIIGGYISIMPSWRWIFFSTAVPGFLIYVFCYYAMIDDRPQRVEAPPFDFLGLGLFIGTLVFFSILIDRGQRDNWLTSPWIAIVLPTFVVFFVLFVARELTHEFPVVNLRVLEIPHFFFFAALKFLLAGNMQLLISQLVSYMVVLRDYPRHTTTTVIFPSVFALILGHVVSRYYGTQQNARLRILFGFGLLAMTNWQLADVNLNSDKWWLSACFALAMFATGFAIMPVFRLFTLQLTRQQFTQAGGLSSMVRWFPGFVAPTIMAILMQRATDYNYAELSRNTLPNRAAQVKVERDLALHTLKQGSSLALAGKQAHATVKSYTHQTALMMAYRTAFQYMALVMIFGMGLSLFTQFHPELEPRDVPWVRTPIPIPSAS